MMHDAVARFHPRLRGMARLLGLVLLAGLQPACYSSSGHTYMAPMAPAGPGVLFSDNFVSFPGASWTVPSAATVSVTNPYTPPFYYLTMTDTTRPGGTSTTTTMSFTTQPLTVQVDLETSATSLSTDTASIIIVDGSNAVLASAVYSASTGMIALQVGAGAATNVAFSAGAFHTVVFNVTSGNMATWSVAGTTTAAVAFGPSTTKLQLAVSYGSTPNPAPVFRFGNVSISDP